MLQVWDVFDLIIFWQLSYVGLLIGLTVVSFSTEKVCEVGVISGGQG